MPMLRSSSFFLSLAAVAAILLAAPAAQAQNPVELGVHGNWTAYRIDETGGKVCYMAAQPDKAEGKYNRRGEIFALITHRPAEGSRNVFSYISGYEYKPGSDVTVTIDGQSFTLFSQDDTAWAPDAATDEKIANAIRKGSKMVVKGRSGRDTATTDTFILKGSGAAHDAINAACAK
ncbi:invasion associated locus B family protein [Micavibrio aeruginosavorus]|uniref:invasion associated locus B family protein n=1 Tax=Micavibrio aeruginosavorus TaxID=349221 RepID=UPI003F4AB7E6